MSYNEATTDALSKQLLFNIARARHHQPIHFTAVSNIAATFNFELSAGATPALTGEDGGLLAPIFGGSVSENPTISLTPVEGEEFTKRLLAPFQENKITLLLRQGFDIDLLLRMLAEEFRMNEGKREIVYHNRPSDRVGYPTFRRIVLHLSSIQDRNSLYVEPLTIRRDWVLPADTITPDGFRELQQEGYSIELIARQSQYRLSKESIGHIVMTNFDPDLLSQEERVLLYGEAAASAPNELILEVRPGYAGGSYPLTGKFRLRGFHKLLTFLGRSIHEEPEYHVDKYPRTPAVTENPVTTMELVEAPSPPKNADVTVEFNGLYYALRPEKGYQWNRNAFRLLFMLFQMTVTEPPQFGTPSITISK